MKFRAHLGLSPSDTWAGPSDMTVYQGPCDAVAELNKIQGGGDSFGIDGDCLVSSPHLGDTSRVRGRGFACSSHRGEYVSITLRVHGKDSRGMPPSGQAPAAADGSASTPFAPEASVDAPVCLKRLCACLAGHVFPGGEDETGIVLVTGSTNSMKSLVARGLVAHRISQAMRRRAAKNRRPHLVTIEDPIEEWYLPDGDGNPRDPAAVQGLGLDYTPRQVGRDVQSVDAALRDALRQTPDVAYVGEIRTSAAWRAVVDFARTGHLVVTTAHAGSLREAMGKLFHETEARSPAQRGQIAESIVALIHLKRFPVDGAEKPAVLPAVWRRSPAAVAALVGDGLASLLPHHPPHVTDARGGPNRPHGAIGRRWFVTEVASEEWQVLLEPRALASDLEGL